MSRPIFFQEADRPVTARPASRRWLARLIVFLIATVFALFLAEGLTRMIWGRSVVLFPRYHEDVTYGKYTIRRLEPSTTFRHTSADGSWLFTTNAQGFRDTVDYQYDKPQGVKRVLCLGDSQTEGFEASQEAVYPAILKRRLQRMGHRVEVMNTGISGFGTAEELAFLENEGVKYHPDVVVVGWFINDLDDNEKSALFKLTEGGLQPQNYEHIPGVAALKVVNNILPLRWASEHSYFYSALFNRAWQARKELLSKTRSVSVNSEYTTLVAHQGAKISTYQTELAAALLKRLHDFCEARNIKLLIVDIPWLPEDNTGFGSSVPQSLEERFESSADEVLRADEVLGKYRGVTNVFQPHGQHHISETSHLMIGMAAAEVIGKWWTPEPQQ